MQLTNYGGKAHRLLKSATENPAESAGGATGKRSPRSDVKETLLDTSELLFADHGYAACTFRVIAERSGINQGLLHYYFRTKQRLFSEVFLRRARVVANERMAGLDEEERLHGVHQVPVDALVRAFIRPTLQMAQRGSGGRAFLRIHSHLRSEPGDIGLALRREAFGPSTLRYVKALCRACPHLPKKVIYWRFNFMVGSYLVVTSQSGRLEDYSGGTCSSGDMETALNQVIPFVVAGFKAPAPGRKS